MANKNILLKKTKEKYGYSVSELKPSSEKLVVWSCSKCKSEQEKKYRLAKKNKLCLACSNKKNANTNLDKRVDSIKEWHSKNEHPLKGTKRPQNVLDALKKANIGRIKTKKELDYRSELMSGEKNPMFGKTHTEESIIKMKEFQKKNLSIRGKNSNFYGKKPKHGIGEWYICNDGSKIWMRSSWEIKFAKYLDKYNIEWLYEPKLFDITYNNKEGTYSPDFYIIKEKKFIEIKGWWRDDAFAKYSSFVNQYPNILILLYDKVKLKELKIL